MFPLYTKTFPRTAADLTAQLNESLKRLFSGAPNPVAVRDQSYPEVAEIRITLDGAELRLDPPKPPAVKGASAPALRVGQLHITASDLAIGPAIADLHLVARAVALHQAKDSKDEVVLLLQSAADGRVEISTTRAELESAIAAVAKSEAGKQGVTIENVQLMVQERSARSVTAEVQLKGRKLFFSTLIRISANLDLDDDLNATLSGLTCKGEGAIGTIACSVLAPHLEKLDGRTFPLMALPLGEVRLRDVRLSAGDKLTVTAEFGA